MKNVRSEKIPTAPAHAARLAVYQATRRPVSRRGGEWVETSWGRIRVAGRLGQRHADVIDLCLYLATQTHREADGRMQLLVDPHQIRVRLGSKKYSHQSLWRLLKDIMSAVIEWETSDGRRGLGHIISDVAESSVTVSSPSVRLERGRGTQARRALWKVTIGAAWASLIDTDIALRYDPTPLAALDYGVSQAAARLMLGHAEGARYNIETVLDHLQIPPAGQVRRDARRWLHADAGGLAEMGVRIDAGALVRVKRD